MTTRGHDHNMNILNVSDMPQKDRICHYEAMSLFFPDELICPDGY